RTSRWVFRRVCESGRASRAERREEFRDYGARHTCADASGQRNRFWRRTNSSYRIITDRILYVKVILWLGEFAYGSGPEILNPYVALQVWAGTPAYSLGVTWPCA